LNWAIDLKVLKLTFQTISMREFFLEFYDITVCYKLRLKICFPLKSYELNIFNIFSSYCSEDPNIWPVWYLNGQL
jgi:hypothetical protein